LGRQHNAFLSAIVQQGGREIVILYKHEHSFERETKRQSEMTGVETVQRMKTLFELVQDSNKCSIRNDLIMGIKLQERLCRKSRKQTVYDFPSLFSGTLYANGQDGGVDLFDVYSYVLCQSATESGNTLLRHCVSSCVNDRRQHRFMEFMRFVLSVNRQTALDIFTAYLTYLQTDVMDKDFSMTNLRTVVKWDHMLKGPLFWNNQDSHMHYVLGRRTLITASVLQRLRLVVSVYGDDYLTWIPTRDAYAADTLVNIVLHSADLSCEDPLMREVLDFLIHACPAALRISSRSPLRHDAFSAVIQRCDCPQNPQHQWIVQNVMQYADLERDILGVVPGTNHLLLLDMVKRASNVLVLQFIARKFGENITL